MGAKSDEQILIESYKKLFEVNAKNSNTTLCDKKAVSKIMSKFPIVLLRLDQDNTLTALDIQKNLFKAKSYMVQLYRIKKKNPSCIQPSLERSMDSMLHAVCRREAEMIKLIRIQETGGDRIDLEKIFEKKTNINMLVNFLARDIVKKALTDVTSVVGEKGNESIWYITETGKKYHVKDCVYCKGKTLINATNAMVYNQNLKPCKCVERTQVVDDKTCVTAFVDESIHFVKWNENGIASPTSSFSYIICRGNLLSEENIREENIITKGVDHFNETASTERVTEAAIGKVLISLLYDYEFTGDIQIYIDNQSVVNKWKNQAVNSKLATQFKSVSVSYVPRERNTIADQLGREKMYLCLSSDVYNSIVNKNNKYNTLWRQYERVSLENKRLEEKLELEHEKNISIGDKITEWFKSLFRQLKIA